MRLLGEHIRTSKEERLKEHDEKGARSRPRADRDLLLSVRRTGGNVANGAVGTLRTMSIAPYPGTHIKGNSTDLNADCS